MNSLMEIEKGNRDETQVSRKLSVLNPATRKELATVPDIVAASLWGKNSDELQRVARQIEAGTVWINQHAIRNPFVPAAAYKNSGIGVEFGEEGLREFCHIQVIGTQKW